MMNINILKQSFLFCEIKKAHYYPSRPTRGSGERSLEKTKPKGKVCIKKITQIYSQV